MLYKKYWGLDAQALTPKQLLNFEREVRDNENVILIRQTSFARFNIIMLMNQHDRWETLEAKNMTIYTIIQLYNY